MDTTEGGAASEVRSAVRKVETGRETTWVANVTAEIHRDERRGSSEAGKRAQNLAPDQLDSKVKTTATHAPASIGALVRMWRPSSRCCESSVTLSKRRIVPRTRCVPNDRVPVSWIWLASHSVRAKRKRWIEAWMRASSSASSDATS